MKTEIPWTLVSDRKPDVYVFLYFVLNSGVIIGGELEDNKQYFVSFAKEIYAVKHVKAWCYEKDVRTE